MLPVLSYMGVPFYALPTMLVSNPFEYGKFATSETTSYISDVLPVWRQLGFGFDAIATGIIASESQARLVSAYCREQAENGTKVFVDPVMGDHGTAYRTCTPELCRGMRALAENADVITPNLTEAALLLDRPYEEIQRTDAYEVVRRLSLGGRRSVVLTGYSSEPGQTGALCFDRDSGESKAVQTPREPQDFSGTGDLFASVLAGGVARGVPLFQAAQAAADFVRDCIARTLAEGLTEQDGVDFEPLLGQLTSSK